MTNIADTANPKPFFLVLFQFAFLRQPKTFVSTVCYMVLFASAHLMKEITDRSDAKKTKKTSTVSFRIDSEYDRLLRREAEQKKISLNTLVNQIFGEYVELHRYIKLFGTIILSKDAFKLILDGLDNDKITNLAIDIATKAPREFILFKWKEIDSSNVIDFIKMFFDHCGYGQYDHQMTESKINKFSIRHELGKKGSIFLKSYIEAVVRDTLGAECRSVITENSVTLTF